MRIEDALKLLTQGLVDTEEAVVVYKTSDDVFEAYIIGVEPGEVGMVIGKGGSMIRRIREWAYAVATKHHKRITIEVKENGEK